MTQCSIQAVSVLVIPNPKLPDSIPVVTCLLSSGVQAGLALYRRSLQISAVCNLALQVYVRIDAPHLHFESRRRKRRM